MISFSLNTEDVSFDGDEETPLLWVIRDHLKLTGTKYGCGAGQCGACTVHIGDTAVLSCLVPAGRSAGETLVTIEGLAADDGTLHPLQQAFIDAAAVQCGYCIPGFLMAGAALGAEADRALSAQDVKLGMSGNLCRCTGYYAIEQAVDAAFSTPDASNGEASS